MSSCQSQYFTLYRINKSTFHVLLTMEFNQTNMDANKRTSNIAVAFDSFYFHVIGTKYFWIRFFR